MRHLNSFREQTRGAPKQRYYPVRGFGSFEAASRLCAAYDELNSCLRVHRRGERPSSPSAQRRAFDGRERALIADLGVACSATGWHSHGRHHLEL